MCRASPHSLTRMLQKDGLLCGLEGEKCWNPACAAGKGFLAKAGCRSTGVMPPGMVQRYSVKHEDREWTRVEDKIPEVSQTWPNSCPHVSQKCFKRGPHVSQPWPKSGPTVSQTVAQK